MYAVSPMALILVNQSELWEKFQLQAYAACLFRRMSAARPFDVVYAFREDCA